MGASGISLDGVVLALLLLALTAIGGMVMVYGSNIRKDIAKLFNLIQEHADDDLERFDRTDRRVNVHAQRLTKLDGEIE